MSDDNVKQLPVRPKTKSRGPLEVVRTYGGCRHLRSQVDEKKAEVTCADCGEKLNPIWVLQQLAYEDARLIDRWSWLRAQLELMGERVRCKCDHCGKFTHIRPKATTFELQEAAERIKREELS